MAYVRGLWSRTWLPAALLALSAPLYVWWGVRAEPLFWVMAIAYAATLVRAIWWTCTRKMARVDVATGMGVGALCGAVVFLIPTVALIVSAQVGSGGGAPAMLIGLLLVMAFFISMPVGAVIGGFTPLVQRWVRRAWNP